MNTESPLAQLEAPAELCARLASEGLSLRVIPYSRGIGRALAVAAAELRPDVAYLVPARTDTAWWWEYCRWGEIRFLRGRVRFGGHVSGAPFPSAVVVFGRLPNTGWLDWKAPR